MNDDAAQLYGHQNDESRTGGGYTGLTTKEIRQVPQRKVLFAHDAVQMLALMGQAEDIASWATMTDSLEAKDAEVSKLKRELNKITTKACCRRLYVVGLMPRSRSRRSRR